MKVGPDVQHQQHALGIDERRDFRLVRERGDLVEIGRGGETRHQVTRSLAGVLVIDREWDAVQIERGGVAEDEQLQDGRDEHDNPASLVLQQGQELLRHERSDSSEHCVSYSKRFRNFRRLTPRKNAAINTSTSALGSTTDHTLPAKNTVCRIATK